MSDGDRGERSQNLIALGLCAIAIFGTVVLAFVLGNALGVHSGRDQATAREHYEETKQNNLNACIGREGPAAIECASEAIESAQEQSDARQDLYAQQDMANWAFWLLLFTGVTVVITGVGVFFVKRTLEATLEAVEDTGEATKAMKDANDIARAQLALAQKPTVYVTCRGTYATSGNEASSVFQESEGNQRFISPTLKIQIHNSSPNTCFVEAVSWWYEHGIHRPQVENIGDLINADKPMTLVFGVYEGFARGREADPVPIDARRLGIDGFFISREELLAGVRMNPPPLVGFLIYADSSGARWKHSFAFAPVTLWSDDIRRVGGREFNAEKRIT